MEKLKNTHIIDNMINKKFGRLLVISKAPLKNKYIEYECLCDCGKVTIKNKSNLTNGTTNSCGCLLLDKSRENIKKAHAINTKHDPLELTIKRVWEKRYSDGDLTLEQFKILSQKICSYCLAPPSNLANWYKGDKRSSQSTIDKAYFKYNGLDRVDNTKPHNNDNVVACCIYCNRAKLDMTIESYRLHIIKILEFRRNNYNDSYSSSLLPIIPTSNIMNNIQVGVKIGKLKIIKIYKNNKKGTHLVECDCGKQKITNEIILRTKICLCNNIKCTLIYDPKIVKGRLIWISGGYKKEGLSFDNFYYISQLNCYYCNIAPSNVYNPPSHKSGQAFIYNGIDRLDSLKPHTADNIVSACWHCNRIKSDRTLKEFDEWLTAIKINFLNKIE